MMQLFPMENTGPQIVSESVGNVKENFTALEPLSSRPYGSHVKLKYSSSSEKGKPILAI